MYVYSCCFHLLTFSTKLKDFREQKRYTQLVCNCSSILSFSSPPPLSLSHTVFPQGIMSRVYEAVIVLLMLALLVIGTVWVADSLTLHVNSTSFYLMVILFGNNLVHSHHLLLLPLPPSFLFLPPSLLLHLSPSS